MPMVHSFHAYCVRAFGLHEGASKWVIIGWNQLQTDVWHHFRLTSSLFMRAISLQVFGAFLLPFLVTYRTQLHSRRQWRQGVLKRLLEPLDQGGSTGIERGAVEGSCRADERDPALDIRPTWSLFLPESVAFLTLCFAAGFDVRMLQYMV